MRSKRSKTVDSKWFKEAKKFPIGTMVKFQDIMSLRTRYGLVVNYLQVGLANGEDVMGLSLLVDGEFEFVRPTRCRSVSRPYVKTKGINFLDV